MSSRNRSRREGEVRHSSGTRRAVERQRVLVIDDEAKLLAVVRIILQDAHDVEITTDAREALEWISGGERFDSILCDVMMNPMNGMDFHLELSRRVPEQADRIVFMSGGVSLPRVRAFLERIPNTYIEKPFTEETLLGIVEARNRPNGSRKH